MSRLFTTVTCVILGLTFLSPASAETPATSIQVKGVSGSPMVGVDVLLQGPGFNLLKKTDTSGIATFPNATGPNWKIDFSTGGDAPNCISGSAGEIDMAGGSKSFVFSVPAISDKYSLQLLDETGTFIPAPQRLDLRNTGQVPGLMNVYVSGNYRQVSTGLVNVTYTPCGNPLKWDESGNLALWALGAKELLVFSATKVVSGGSENISTRFAEVTGSQVKVQVGKFAHWSPIKAPNPAYIDPYAMDRSFSATLLGLTSPLELDPLLRGARFLCDDPKVMLSMGEGFGDTLTFAPKTRARFTGEYSCYFWMGNLVSDSVKINFVNPAKDLAKFTKKKTTCAALNKVFPGGVAANSRAVNKGGLAKYTPVVSAVVYNLNKAALDRDKDSIACEK